MFGKNLITFLFLILCFISIECISQENIRQTQSVINENGKSYYQHTVLKGQTIYSISKAYQTSIEQIENDNPETKNGIKAGMVLKIVIINPQSINTSSPENQFIFHTIQKGETLYSLSRMYNVDISQIYNYNPSAKNGLKDGQVLKIPSGQNIEQAPLNTEEFLFHLVENNQTLTSIASIYQLNEKQIIKANPHLEAQGLIQGEIIRIPKNKSDIDLSSCINSDPDYFYHTVQKKQTLYSISNIYHAPISNIISANPQLQNRSLQEGEIVKIPRHPGKKTQKEEEITRPRLYKQDSATKQVINCNPNQQSFNKPFQIALLLPLYSNINDTLDSYYQLLDIQKNKQPRPERLYPKSEMFIDLYEGMLLAVDDIRKLDVSVNLHVFDTQNDSIIIKKILQEEIFSQSDLIIGPVYNVNLQMVSEIARQHEINIISPLSVNESFLENNPFSFQVSPSTPVTINYLTQFLLEHEVKNLLIVDDSNNLEFISNFKFQLDSQFKNIERPKIKDIFMLSNDDSVDATFFSKDTINYILIPSEDQAFVSDVISKLNARSEVFPIVLLGRQRWMRFDNIDLDYFHKMQTYILSNSYIDYTKENVKKFIQSYRLVFHTEPGKYAFQGYDIMYFYLNALIQYGKHFNNCVNQVNANLLQTSFLFEQINPNGGFENKTLYLLKYDQDFLIKNIRTYSQIK